MVEGGRRILGIGLAVIVLLAGCSGARRGKLVDRSSLPESTAIQGRALTSEVDGLRVLWNGEVLGKDHKQRGFVAGNRAQFAALWRKVSPPQDEPSVDFSKYVALAVVGLGSVCPWEVVGVELGAENVLRVKRIGSRSRRGLQIGCIDLGVREALVLAIPRSILGSSITFVEREAFRFSIPKPGEPSTQILVPPATPTPLIVPWGETIELPDRGTISLRTLSNGARVWVAHQGDGAVDVLSSVRSLDNPFEDFHPFDWATLNYFEDIGRFWGGWDSTGQNVHGGPPIQSFAWTRADSKHIVLKGAQPTEAAPIQAPRVAPHLVGESRAYSDVPLSEWSDIPDGHVAQVDLDLVWLKHRPGELCKSPPPKASLEYFEECPAGSPVVSGLEGGHGHPTEGGSIHYGPWVVQRQGRKALLLATGRIGWTGRRVPAPPERECPLRARSGKFPGYRIEWTQKDGPEAYQQLCGGPVLPVVMVSAVVRGEGTKRIGDALPDELEPLIAPIVGVNNWGTGCDGSLSVGLPGDTDACPLDPVIETIGKFLRERDANDRVIVRMGLRAAPAL